MRWIILLYHNISWEDNAFTRGIGGTCPPDLFERQVKQVKKYGDLVSVNQGLELSSKEKSKSTIFSFWFDDGFSGVRKYALPILKNNGVTGAISICSKFINRDELFWRSKLSYIESVDGMRLLRSSLKKTGFHIESQLKKIKNFTMDNFSDEILLIIEQIYNRLSNEIIREQAFGIFENIDGLKILKNNNWIIANHSASHYPVSEDSYIDHFFDEYIKCDRFIEEYLEINNPFWVLPFDRKSKRSKKVDTIFDNLNTNKFLVNVGKKINHKHNIDSKRLFRFGAHITDNTDFQKFINGIVNKK